MLEVGYSSERLLEEFPGIAALVAGNGKLLFGNRAFLCLPTHATGVEREPFGPVRAYCQETILRAAERTLLTGKRDVFEMGVTDPEESLVWFRVDVSAVPESTHAPRHAMVMATDRASERRREAALQRSRQLLVDAQAVAHLGTWEWDVERNVVTWSEETFRIYGVSPVEHVPNYENFLLKVHPQDRERVSKTMAEAVARKVPFSHDERILRPDGAIRYLHTWGIPGLDKNGNLVRLMGVCQDITERMEAEALVRKSEERFRQIVETAEEGVWLVDSEGRTTLVNRKLANMLGYEPEEMLGRNFTDFMEEGLRAAARAAMNRRREGKREHREAILQHKRGHKVWVSVGAGPIYDEEGKFSGALGMVSDISLKKRNEARLAAQEHIFELLGRGAPIEEALAPLVLALESVGNGGLGSILLLSEDGRSVRTGSAPHLPVAYNNALEGLEIGPEAGSCGTAAFRNEPVIVEDIETSPLWAKYLPLARAHGLRACWSTPIRDTAGKVLGTFAFYFREPRAPTEADLRLANDYTKSAALVLTHVRLRDSLLESEERFRQLAEATSEAVLIIDKGKILLANANLALYSGYSLDELIGRDVRELASPEYREEISRNIVSGKNVTFVMQAVRKDGTRVWSEVKGREANFQGRPVRLVSVRDITDSRRIEAQREQVLEQERAARLEAERSIRIRDEFLAIASHELKTPLTPLKIELQLLRRFVREFLDKPTPKNELILKAMGQADRELDRLGRLVSDLLDVTRISAGTMQLNRAPCDLSQLVRDCVKRLESELARVHSPATLDIASHVTGHWDGLRLDQVVTNLLTNAIKYGGGHPIHVALREEGGHARLTVKDHGIGIRKEDQAKVFDRFVRVAPVENYGGLGLGLFIVSQIVAAHGGRVKVESELGQGSCFVVDLPIAGP